MFKCIRIVTMSNLKWQIRIGNFIPNKSHVFTYLMYDNIVEEGEK